MQSLANPRPSIGRRDDFRAFRPISTRWMDNDVFGHVNNVTYYSYFDTAVTGWLAERRLIGLLDGPMWMVAETGCRFFGEVAFPELVMVGLRVARVGSSSVRYELAVFRGDDDKAAAAVEGWQAKVEQCEIRAPFDGRVADVFAHVFDLPSPTAPILRIVDPANLEVEMLIPSRAVARVAPGVAFSLSVEETGDVVAGRVVRVGAAVDPVSQTLKVVGALDPRTTKSGAVRLPVLPGMSGKADFGADF